MWKHVKCVQRFEKWMNGFGNFVSWISVLAAIEENCNIEITFCVMYVDFINTLTLVTLISTPLKHTVLYNYLISWALRGITADKAPPNRVRAIAVLVTAMIKPFIYKTSKNQRSILYCQCAVKHLLSPQDNVNIFNWTHRNFITKVDRHKVST